MMNCNLCQTPVEITEVTCGDCTNRQQKSQIQELRECIAKMLAVEAFGKLLGPGIGDAPYMSEYHRLKAAVTTEALLFTIRTHMRVARFSPNNKPVEMGYQAWVPLSELPPDREGQEPA